MDLDEFYDRRRKPKPCVVARGLEQLNNDDRNLIVRALNTPDTVDTRIAAGMTARGATVGGNSVTKHRRGECCCPEPSDG